jgi:hypothetical protein
MPFADKFRAMLDFPFAGETVGAFVVESVDVRHVEEGAGRIRYPVRMVLRGPGGQQGVLRALKVMFASHPMTFSGYGNPYQLWFGKPEVETLGDGRYAVTVEGAGARVHLAEELERFLAYLDAQGQLATPPEGAVREPLVEAYLERYKAEIERKVGRYRSRLRRAGDAAR